MKKQVTFTLPILLTTSPVLPPASVSVGSHQENTDFKDNTIIVRHKEIHEFEHNMSGETDFALRKYKRVLKENKSWLAILTNIIMFCQETKAA